MILSEPQRFESFGAVRIYDVSRVLALDGYPSKRVSGVRHVDRETIRDVASRTAIVIPVKDEDMLTLENVVRAIPLESPLIIVSASSRKPVDRYKSEIELARMVSHTLGRDIVLIYQGDEAWVEALTDTPLSGLLDDGMVRRGKGEGMILGLIAAAALDADYVGFIDSDNYVPGAALEYAWIYYSTFARATSKYSMVRIIWPFKGKLASSDLYLRKRGRVSMHTNSVLNYALSIAKRIETEIVRTANSGEHALSMELALTMEWAGGFAVEPYQLVWLLDRCFHMLDPESCPYLPDHIDVYQVESRNPHIHAERGDTHIADMVAASLGTIYHSSLATDDVKERIERIMGEYSLKSPPPAPRTYSLRGVDVKKIFASFMSLSDNSYYLEAG